MMGKRRRWIGMVGLALAIALIAAACGGGGGGGGGGGTTGGIQKGGVFRTAQDDFGFTNAFDPTGEYLASAFSMYDALLRTLVATNHTAGPKGNELHPDLATALPTISSDQLTYTFKLKSGLKFGPLVNCAITSKDIEYYFGTIKGMDGKAKSSAPISGIETPDDSTIIFHLTKPTGDFLYRLAMAAAAPVPQEVAKCFTKAGDYGRYLISSGPYMLKGSEALKTT